MGRSIRQRLSNREERMRLETIFFRRHGGPAAVCSVDGAMGALAVDPAFGLVLFLAGRLF